MKKNSAIKKKMQMVNFSHVDEFFEFITPEEFKIVERLRALIVDCIPDCKEKLAYNVPYYKRNANICFLWPGSVAWGNSKRVGVRFGFTTGHLLSDETCYLDKGERKFVYWVDIVNLNQIEEAIIRKLLYEAVLIDEEVKLSKKMK